jgi:group I intron endonuclease
LSIWEEKNLEQKMKNENLTENGVCDITGIIVMKNDKRDSKDIINEKVSGIYKIVNKINGKYYVGSTDDIQRRKYHHWIDLIKNKHSNNKLQNAWNKYGENNFQFLIVKETPVYQLLVEEQQWLNMCEQTPETNYNISYDAKSPFKGKHHTKEIKMKIGNGNRGKYQSLELKSLRSKIMKGKYDGINNPNYGKKMSNNTKNKLLSSRTDKNIYTFQNIISNEIFLGTRQTFRNHIGIKRDSVHQLIHGIIKICKHWKLIV